MIKDLWGCHLLQFNIDRNRMALICADTRFVLIERVSLLFIFSNDPFKGLAIQSMCFANAFD